MLNTDFLRIRSANILLVTIKALGNEIAKNLVLAGVGSLTILDHEVVTEDDLASQFFVSEDNIGQNVRVELQSNPACTNMNSEHQQHRLKYTN